jgi:hypothetical protein
VLDLSDAEATEKHLLDISVLGTLAKKREAETRLSRSVSKFAADQEEVI